MANEKNKEIRIPTAEETIAKARLICAARNIDLAVELNKAFENYYSFIQKSMANEDAELANYAYIEIRRLFLDMGKLSYLTEENFTKLQRLKSQFNWAPYIY